MCPTSKMQRFISGLPYSFLDRIEFDEPKTLEDLKSVYQQNFPSQSINKPFGEAPGKTNNTKREPLKCWGCGEEHLLRDCPYMKQNSGRVYNIQEATTVSDVARSMP
jgi:hypothetical protein